MRFARPRLGLVKYLLLKIWDGGCIVCRYNTNIRGRLRSGIFVAVLGVCIPAPIYNTVQYKQCMIETLYMYIQVGKCLLQVIVHTDAQSTPHGILNDDILKAVFCVK